MSYSASSENGSSPEKQAEFVRRLRGFVAGTDGRRLLFARYVPWRDVAPAPGTGRAAAETARRRDAFLKNRGLQDAAGQAKPAWREWVRLGR